MSRLPNAILFDLDDTLLRAYANSDMVWEEVTAELEAHLHPFAPGTVALAIQTHAREFWADPERHRYWRQRLYESRREVVRQALPALAPEIAELVADRYSARRDAEMALHPGAVETLDALRARGVRLGLVTNGAGEPQRAKLVRFSLERCFDHIQIEGEHGFGKPEERAYRHALDVLGVTPVETWMVGDNLEWEVAAPQRIGIHSIWFDGEGQGLPPGSAVRPDRTIRELGELVPRR